MTALAIPYLRFATADSDSLTGYHLVFCPTTAKLPAGRDSKKTFRSRRVRANRLTAAFEAWERETA